MTKLAPYFIIIFIIYLYITTSICQFDPDKTSFPGGENGESLVESGGIWQGAAVDSIKNDIPVKIRKTIYQNGDKNCKIIAVEIENLRTPLNNINIVERVDDAVVISNISSCYVVNNIQNDSNLIKKIIKFNGLSINKSDYARSAVMHIEENNILTTLKNLTGEEIALYAYQLTSKKGKHVSRFSATTIVDPDEYPSQDYSYGGAIIAQRSINVTPMPQQYYVNRLLDQPVINYLIDYQASSDEPFKIPIEIAFDNPKSFRYVQLQVGDKIYRPEANGTLRIRTIIDSNNSSNIALVIGYPKSGQFSIPGMNIHDGYSWRHMKFNEIISVDDDIYETVTIILLFLTFVVFILNWFSNKELSNQIQSINKALKYKIRKIK